MSEPKEKQIEEITDTINDLYGVDAMYYGVDSNAIAHHLYEKGYRKQGEGEWEWFEEWSPSTPEHPRECDDCGWRCGECKSALADMVGGYWDDASEKPKLEYCPNCAAKMKGGANE